MGLELKMGCLSTAGQLLGHELLANDTMSRELVHETYLHLP